MTATMNTPVLSRHHADLDQRVAVLLKAAESGDSQDLAGAWEQFERELLRHLDLEEQHLFPRYLAEHEAEVTALKKEHDAIRSELLDLGVHSDLHCLRAEAVSDFVTALRDHAAREEEGVYRWSHTHLPGDVWSAVAQGLAKAGETAPAGSAGEPRAAEVRQSRR